MIEAGAEEASMGDLFLTDLVVDLEEGKREIRSHKKERRGYGILLSFAGF